MSSVTVKSKDPAWVKTAKGYVGLKEIVGPKHNPTIVKWLANLGAWWREDETPWCGVFVAECMSENGLELPKHWYRAKGWLDWGVELKTPVPGCVCILERKGGGHVFFALAKDAKGNIIGVGGNQGNQVSIATFEASRVVGYRWAKAVPVPGGGLPVVTSAAKLSTNEG